jgi:mono/diheme cytochrome c family protein
MDTTRRAVYNAVQVSPRRLLVLLTLIVGAVLMVALPAAMGAYNPPSKQETNGVPDGSAKDQPGHAAAGKKLFVVFCGKCHVMQAVHTKGTLGPNLDRDPVSYTNVVNSIVQGVGGIQAEYLLRALTFSQIYDVAKFVTTARR